MGTAEINSLFTDGLKCDAVVRCNSLFTDGLKCDAVVRWSALTSWEKLQIENAARGLVSGSLKEWPLLRLALVSFGVRDSAEFRHTPACVLMQLCVAIVVSAKVSP